MLTSKMKTYLSDEMTPKKVFTKKQKRGISNIRIRFFNFNFFAGIFSQKQVCYFENIKELSTF
jgi:hypothetical protein